MTVRILAESQWVGQLPGDLEEIEESRVREMMRIQKVRVAMGELDIVGQDVWNHVAVRPRMGRVVSESVLNRPSPAYRYVQPSTILKDNEVDTQSSIRQSGLGYESEFKYDLLNWNRIYLICYHRNIARDQ